MKFVFFSAQYLPTAGGVERYTHNLARRLSSMGHEVTVVTSSLPGLPREDEDGAVRVIRLPSFGFMKGRFPCVRIFGRRKRLREIFSQDFDLAVIQTRFYPLSAVASFLCRKYKSRRLVVEHGTAHLIKGGVMGFLGNIYEHVVCSFVYRNLPQFYGVSSACCKWLEHFGIKTDDTLYNGVDPARVKSAAREGRKTLAAKLPDLSGKFIVSYSARFIPEKGPGIMTEAFERLFSGREDGALIMSGDGPDFEELLRHKPDNVIMTGRLDYAENMALIDMGDVFCLPTASEGFATTVLERAALETPVITTPVGGSPEIIISPRHGLLMEDMSRDSVYNALKYAFENPGWRLEAAKNAFSVLSDRFTVEKTAEKLEDIAAGRVRKEKVI